MSKPKKAAKKKPAAKNRSAKVTTTEYASYDDPQEIEPGQPATTLVPAQNVQGETVQQVPTAAITATEPAPRAIEGEVVPDPSTLDPHTLVDMRIRHDPRFLGGDVQLLPTTDPNIKYVKPSEPPPPETEEEEEAAAEKAKS